MESRLQILANIQKLRRSICRVIEEPKWIILEPFEPEVFDPLTLEDKEVMLWEKQFRPTAEGVK